MKQILPRLKEVNKHLAFAKRSFTKCGFRHVTQYIDGLIALNKKTVKQISRASLEETHHSAISRLLTEASVKQQKLEDTYLRKAKYVMRHMKKTLLLDDTLAEHDGKKIEQTQRHFDHSNNDYITGHQFFTALIHTQLLQLPLFPLLYSKDTDSKIKMANDTIDRIHRLIHIDTVLFDSWYSDKDLIKKCRTKGMRVICPIKTNRLISFVKGEWPSLKEFSVTIELNKLDNYFIDEKKYKIGSYTPKLNGVAPIRMLVSYEWDDDKQKWLEPFYLISTRPSDTPIEIIRTYRIRWHIETYHRDIKQNLGFATSFVRRKQGIVRHAMLVALAYAILRLFMFSRGLDMTIGECITHIQDAEMDGFMREIIEIEDKQERINHFEEVFIRRTAKV